MWRSAWAPVEPSEIGDWSRTLRSITVEHSEAIRSPAMLPPAAVRPSLRITGRWTFSPRATWEQRRRRMEAACAHPVPAAGHGGRGDTLGGIPCGAAHARPARAPARCSTCTAAATRSGSALDLSRPAGRLAKALGRAGRSRPTTGWRPSIRHPAGLEDSVAVYEALLAQGAAPASIALAGDSAGAGLALALALSLRDAGAPAARGRGADLPVGRPAARPRRHASARAARARADAGHGAPVRARLPRRAAPAPTTRWSLPCSATCAACRRSSCTRPATTCSPPTRGALEAARAAEAGAPLEHRRYWRASGTTSTCSGAAAVGHRRPGRRSRRLLARADGARLGGATASRGGGSRRPCPSAARASRR